MNSIMSVMMLVHIIQAESRWFQAPFQLDFVSLQYKLQLESIQQNQNVWTWNKPGITMEVTSQTKSRYPMTFKVIQGISFHILWYLVKSKDMKKISQGPGISQHIWKGKILYMGMMGWALCCHTHWINLGYPWMRGTYPRGLVSRLQPGRHAAAGPEAASFRLRLLSPYHDDIRGSRARTLGHCWVTSMFEF